MFAALPFSTGGIWARLMFKTCDAALERVLLLASYGAVLFELIEQIGGAARLHPMSPNAVGALTDLVRDGATITEQFIRDFRVASANHHRRGQD